MSLVFNMVGGGSGGGPTDSDAILAVTVPSGSTVTMTKSNVTLTPTMWTTAEDANYECALFVISPIYFDFNDWTVVSTKSGDTGGTATGSIKIPTNNQYSMRLEYNLFVFVSGKGAIVPLSTDSQSAASVTISTNSITIAYSGTSYVRALWYNTNAIDFSQFSSVVMEATVTNVRSSPFVFVADAIPVVTDGPTTSKFKSTQTVVVNTDVYTLDLTNINVSGYIGFCGSANMSFTKVVLYK